MEAVKIIIQKVARHCGNWENVEDFKNLSVDDIKDSIDWCKKGKKIRGLGPVRIAKVLAFHKQLNDVWPDN